MALSDLQIDFQKIIQRYNLQLGEAAGQIVRLEAEVDTLREYILKLEGTSKDSGVNADVAKTSGKVSSN